MISLTECRHGGFYRISARNFSFGVFNENTKGFIGIREKFGIEYLFTEYHWDTGEPFGTVHVEEFLEMCPIDDLSESIKKSDCYIDNQILFNWIKQKRNEYWRDDGV